MDNGLWQSSAANTSWENSACATDVRNFRSCMDENKGDLTICGWYLDQLVCLLSLLWEMNKEMDANDFI